MLPRPTEPAEPDKQTGRGGASHLPSRERQAERLNPRFVALQEALRAKSARLLAEASGVVPEEVIVLETRGAVEKFVSAVRRIDGLEWLCEIEEEDIAPDDDFFAKDKHGERSEKPLRGRLFLIFSNHTALDQMVSLWDRWRVGEKLPHGLGEWSSGWSKVFSYLYDVRVWGVRDRLWDTGVLDDWRERAEHKEEMIPCEIELWFRAESGRRAQARDYVVSVVESVNGSVRNEALIEEIGYHALLVDLPIGSIVEVLNTTESESRLVHADDVQFLRAAGQAVGIVVGDERVVDDSPLEPASPNMSEPVVALFDGLPLQSHRLLAGRLVIDDPDGFEAGYQAVERRHGTAMASLIVHGDLDAGDAPLSRRLYVRPILRPDPRSWHQARFETGGENALFVDLLHRAVRRLFEGEGDTPPVGQQICVVSLSVGIRDRLFDSSMSPLARLLDWLAWKYQVLFVVSAGNHAQDIVCDGASDASSMSPQELQARVVRAVAADARHRRMLSPAEAMNVLTVGAVHSDASTGPVGTYRTDPYCDDDLPAVTNAQGMGYRRSVKPDVLLPGGKTFLRRSPHQGAYGAFSVCADAGPPGQRVAAPDPTAGGLSHTCYTRGTSNAAALGSRIACRLYDVLEELRAGPGGEVVESVPYGVWLKTLLVHGANWGSAGDVLGGILRTSENTRGFREYLTRLVGYGSIDPERVSDCTEHRVTALGGGSLGDGEAHVHRFPLPPSLSGNPCWRRLTITLGWMTPVNPFHQSWRVGQLWFTPPEDPLRVKRTEADGRIVQRGTVQHEVLEGERAGAYVGGTDLEIKVSCRADGGALVDEIPYAVGATLEVGAGIDVDIYNEVAVLVEAARVAIGAAG
jgi:hypothetical protein